MLNYQETCGCLTKNMFQFLTVSWAKADFFFNRTRLFTAEAEQNSHLQWHKKKLSAFTVSLKLIWSHGLCWIRMSQSPWVIAADLLLVREHVFNLDSVPELWYCCSHLFFLVESRCCWLRKHPHLLVEQAQCYCPLQSMCSCATCAKCYLLLTDTEFQYKTIIIYQETMGLFFPSSFVCIFRRQKNVDMRNCLDSLWLHFSHQAGVALVMFGARGQGGKRQSVLDTFRSEWLCSQTQESYMNVCCNSFHWVCSFISLPLWQEWPGSPI